MKDDYTSLGIIGTTLTAAIGNTFGWLDGHAAGIACICGAIASLCIAISNANKAIKTRLEIKKLEIEIGESEVD